MKKKILAAVLAAAMVMSMTGVSAAAKSKEKSEGTTFVYGTTGYSEEMGDAGLNPHDNYSGFAYHPQDLPFIQFQIHIMYNRFSVVTDRHMLKLQQ